ncbi:hypothetical protein DEI83_05920 [Curtobacterium sp. MCBD17_021]|nr:hypothetical protein DEI83_05920 [Curtobacterium sp. MCBD17_021]
MGLTVAGIAALAAAALVLRLVALLIGAVGAAPRVPSNAPDLATRIAWSDPDADGHARPRAPGAVSAV